MVGDFRIGEWLVTPSLNQISRNGTSARVEPKAMRVLVYLAEHPGVVSKDQLISAVWPDVFVSDDVLPGCISALRKTLCDDARRPKVIETIHKGGYRLLVPVETLNGNGTRAKSARIVRAANAVRSTFTQSSRTSGPQPRLARLSGKSTSPESRVSAARSLPVKACSRWGEPRACGQGGLGEDAAQ